METYRNVDDFFKENNLDRFNEHEECFRRLVEELEFTTCKQILSRFLENDKITIEELKEKYNQDEYLNNMYKRGSRNSWEWDFLGDAMLRNPNATVKFETMSNCNRTCIAKACARMVAEDY
mgnify:CR=1 FL=1